MFRVSGTYNKDYGILGVFLGVSLSMESPYAFAIMFLIGGGLTQGHCLF